MTVAKRAAAVVIAAGGLLTASTTSASALLDIGNISGTEGPVCGNNIGITVAGSASAYCATEETEFSPVISGNAEYHATNVEKHA
jgi:hypothetical protein